MLLIALLGWSPLCGALRLNPIATTRGAVSVVASAASASAAVPAAPAHRLEVDLGRGLSVAIVVPELADEPDDAAVEQLSDVELVASYGAPQRRTSVPFSWSCGSDSRSARRV